jgi:hypothetical protein
LGSTREIGLNLEKAVKWSKFTPPSPIKATPSESASDSNILINQKITSNQDIAHPVALSDPAILRDSAIHSNPATLSNPAILRNSATFSNPATLSDPAILCNSATFRNLAIPSNPATFGDPSTFSDADDIMLTSPIKSKDVHVNNSTTTASNPTEGRTTAVIAVMKG